MIAYPLRPPGADAPLRRRAARSAGLALATLVSLTVVLPSLLTVGAGVPEAVAAPAKRVASVVKPPGEPAAETGLGPMDELKRANAQLKKQLGNRKPSWSPEAQARNVEIKKIVGSFLDFEELARRSLDPALGRPERQAAHRLRPDPARPRRAQLRATALRPARLRAKLDKEELTGDEAKVLGSLRASAKGKNVTMSLEYKLVKKQNKWVVFDVVTDELSLLENYRAEFNKVIAKDSFDVLLDAHEEEAQRRRTLSRIVRPAFTGP